MKIKLVGIFLLVILVFLGCDDANLSENENFILNLPPMKSQFAGKFMIGNIFNPGDVSGSKVTNPFLTRHFDVLTAENNMKPGYIAPSKGTYNYTTADNMVNAAISSGFKVVGHTLLWHSQNADWMTSSVTLADMKKYVTDVVGHFKGKIYSWDVLNEVFPDGVSASANWKTSMRTNNPWFASSIGANFVYEGFLAARHADPDAILYYNDYNTDQVGKATMIRNMVVDVNNQYLALPAGSKPAGEPADRLLIEGIGMQEHHNLGVNASAIRATLNMFKSMTFNGSSRKIIVSVSELDVLSQTWNQYSSSAAITAAGRTDQAKKYGEYMEVYLDFTDIIERVSLWGVTDDKSWRAKGEPLLFNANGIAKQSYYSFVGALK